MGTCLIKNKTMFEYPKLKGLQDGRRKLLDDQKIDIKRKYKTGNYSQRELAKMYGVSRRLIQFIIYPERLKKLSDIVKREKRWLKYYDREDHNLSMRKNRQKHKELHAKKYNKWRNVNRNNLNIANKIKNLLTK